MSFGAVLSRVGGAGRFQALQVLLLSVPILLMAAHNLLQNFTAAVPPHRCRPPPRRRTPRPHRTPRPNETPRPNQTPRPKETPRHHRPP